jgi:hypothetical protein
MKRTMNCQHIEASGVRCPAPLSADSPSPFCPRHRKPEPDLNSAVVIHMQRERSDSVVVLHLPPSLDARDAALTPADRQRKEALGAQGTLGDFGAIDRFLKDYKDIDGIPLMSHDQLITKWQKRIGMLAEGSNILVSATFLGLSIAGAIGTLGISLIITIPLAVGWNASYTAVHNWAKGRGLDIKEEDIPDLAVTIPSGMAGNIHCIMEIATAGKDMVQSMRALRDKTPMDTPGNELSPTLEEISAELGQRLLACNGHKATLTRLKANKLLQPQISAMQDREFELARAEAWLSEVKGVVAEKLLKVVDDLKKQMKK